MKKYLWIIPIAIAIGVYSVCFNNFFVFDDFVWLQRARNLGQNWGQMFSPDVIYFDPLVYLMFLADSFIVDLDPRWYHAVDIMIHAGNSFLIYYFTKMLTGDEKACLYGSVLFASSFAIADAVLWPSSRVDLVSVMFSLGTLIIFFKYLRTNSNKYLWMSCFIFVLSLGAKGTPVVLPFVLYWLVYMEDKPLRRYIALVPFGLLVCLYFVLLRLVMHHSEGSFTELHFNIQNLQLALSELIIPEQHISSFSLIVSSLGAALLIMVLGLPRFISTPLTCLRRTGVIILAVALVPMLILKDFKIASIENAINLLSSPSHRIYLASVGFALMGGGVLRSLELFIRRYSTKAATLSIALLLVCIIYFNAAEVRDRDRVWELEGMKIWSGLSGLFNYQGRIVEDGFVGLVDFPGSRGFLNPMIKVYFNINEITTEKYLEVGEITDPEILKRAERSSFFVWGKDFKVYDLSDQFKNLLFVCIQANRDPLTSENIIEINKLTTQINHNINKLLP